MSEGEQSVDRTPIDPQSGRPQPAEEGGYDGAPDDEEMPLAEHIREMINRLGKVVVVMALVSLVTFPFADRLINFLWYSFLPGSPEACEQIAQTAQTQGLEAAKQAANDQTIACPRVYHPLALVLSRIKVASVVGFIVALPVLVFQSYLFMRPGLYPHERRYYLASVPTSLVLALIGSAFAYFGILPLLFGYFMHYSDLAARIAFSLTQTFDLMLIMIGLFAAIFQIPLFIMLAVMMGVTTRRWLEAHRLYFWFGFAGVAFIANPDVTGMAPFLVVSTMIILFEGTLLLLRWTGRE